MVTIETDTKQIDCPEHPGQHTATLYCFPHKYAGIWECPTGVSDTHEHTDTEIQEVEPWPTGPEDNPQPSKIYVCVDDGVQVEGDPDQDAAEADN